MATKTANETTIIVDALTGEITVREFTDAEKAQREIDSLAEITKENEKSVKLIAKQSALIKLAELGLNPDEISAILG
jgi:hypothetical protein